MVFCTVINCQKYCIGRMMAKIWYCYIVKENKTLNDIKIEINSNLCAMKIKYVL